MYKLQNQSIQRLSDGASIPLADGNMDYEEYKQWLSEGNTPEPEFTAEELQTKVKAEITSAIQAMLDTQAQSLRYDNMMSARSYAGFVNPFQVEAQELSVWCANCWIKAGELEALGVQMTAEEVMAQMPSYIVEAPIVETVEEPIVEEVVV